MKREDFQNHLQIVSRKILSEYKLPLNKSVVYKIEMDFEKDKKHNSRDELICRSELFDFTSKQKFFNDSEVTTLFCGPSKIKYPELFPLWIKISFLIETETSIILKLLSSTRFRKHSVLKNQELGYPPFEIQR